MHVPPPRKVSFRDAFLFWLKLGFINFGGPTGQIAVLHEEVVERRRWVSDDRFFHALNYCMLLPGPEAQQLATYVGWLLHGTLGGIVAGVLFIFPGFLLMLGLAWLYAAHGDVAPIAAIFYGLRAAVIAIVAAAVIRIASKALRNRVLAALAWLAFVAIFFFEAPFPLIVLGAGALGFVGGIWWPKTFAPSGAHGGSKGVADTVIGDDEAAAASARWSIAGAARTLLVWLGVWWVPLGAMIAWRGQDDVLSEEAVFFSKAAMVTFGGAYAVLPYIGKVAVESYGWIGHEQMVVGLGLAESTPGPLILVTEFVGFLAAYRSPGGLDPLGAGILGAVVTTWATFAPCFLWIFLGAPFIELLRGKAWLSSALSAITAAVAGVVLNLAVWFAVHTLFRRVTTWQGLGMTIPVPDPSTIDVFALVLASAAFIAMWRRRWGVVRVVIACAAAGLIFRALSPHP